MKNLLIKPSNCPHQIPQGMVRNRIIWSQRDNHKTVTYIPQVEDINDQSHHKVTVTDHDLPPEI